MKNPELRKAINGVSYQLAKSFFNEKPEVVPELETEVKGIIEEAGLVYNKTTLLTVREGMDLFVGLMKKPSLEEMQSAQFKSSFLMRMFIDFLLGREEEKLDKMVEDNLKK